MGIKWSGLEDLTATIETKVKLESIKTVIKANGAAMQQRAMQKVPVDTGQLKRSIQLDIRDAGLTAVVEPHTDYAAYVEYGTRYMSAQPYIRPAFNETVKQVKADLEKLAR